jgi:hypothetical protein
MSAQHRARCYALAAPATHHLDALHRHSIIPGANKIQAQAHRRVWGFRSRWGEGMSLPETQPAAPALCRPPPPQQQPRPWRARARQHPLRHCCSVRAAAKGIGWRLLTRMSKQRVAGPHSNVAPIRYCNHPWLTPLQVPIHDTLIWNSSSFPIFPPRALHEALWRARAAARSG